MATRCIRFMVVLFALPPTLANGAILLLSAHLVVLFKMCHTMRISAPTPQVRPLPLIILQTHCLLVGIFSHRVPTQQPQQDTIISRACINIHILAHMARPQQVIISYVWEEQIAVVMLLRVVNTSMPFFRKCQPTFPM